MTDWNPLSDDRRVVLHVVNTLCGGGTERTLVALLNRFDHSRLRHVVVTLREAGVGAAALPDEVACCALGLRGRSRFGFVGLARRVGDWGAAIVHARNTSCWWDAALAALVIPGARAVLGFHGMDRLDAVDSRMGRWARWSSRRGALFTSVSVHGAEIMRDRLRVPESHIRVLRNGVDTLRFQPGSLEARRAAREGLRVPPDAVVVGAVGSLTTIKRFDLLIDAFAKSQEESSKSRLLIVGDGPMRDVLRHRAVEKGVADRVHFPGASRNVAEAFAAMDVYVCCSDFEGVSNALLEAAACGLPIVTTNVGDHATIVRGGGEGVVTSRGNVRELANALSRLVNEPDVRRGMGDASRVRAFDFAIEPAVARYERYYEQLHCSATTDVPLCRSDRAVRVVSPQAV